MRTSPLLALVVVATAASLMPAQQPASPPPPEPQINPDHSVTFQLAFPAAAKVDLSLENHKTPFPMQKTDAGLWTVTTPALPPEIYSYHFLVDGAWVIDPRNPHIFASYTAAGNAFDVPGADTSWEHTAVPHGTMHRHAYTTSVALNLDGNQSEFYVYTPPGYDPRGHTKYPVLYLLHGWSDRASDWSLMGNANDILDNLIAQGKAKPMLVVMPLCYGDMNFLRRGFSVWNKAEEVTRNTSLFSQALLTEVIPQVERMYNVSARREDRAITGFSMGGLESLTIGLNHPGQFAWVGGFSSAVQLLPPVELSAFDPKKAALKLVFIACGTADDLLPSNRTLISALRDHGQPVTSTEGTGNQHNWQEWRPDLAAFATLIFQNK